MAHNFSDTYNLANMMNDRRNTKRFTIDDANNMLPLVGAIVEDWVELSRNVEERQRRLKTLTSGRELNGDDPYAEELAQVQRDLEKNKKRIDEYVRELRQLGVEPGDAKQGTVDFASSVDTGADSKRSFCWKLGDVEILYGHKSSADCDSRQRLTADTLPGGADH